VRADPSGLGRQAVAQVARQAPGWWLDIDLDRLDGKEFKVCGAAADPFMSGGLT